mgnify:CR=1 FL=1
MCWKILASEIILKNENLNYFEKGMLFMKTNKIIITSLLLAIGLILHQIIPGIVFGMKPDLLLAFMILSITITKDFKMAIITGIVAGILGALTTTFPGGQLPNIIDKSITSIIVYTIYKGINSNSSLKLASIYFIGTIVSGSVFLSSALILFGLPAPFLALFVSIVFPTSVFNCFVGLDRKSVV